MFFNIAASIFEEKIISVLFHFSQQVSYNTHPFLTSSMKSMVDEMFS